MAIKVSEWYNIIKFITIYDFYQVGKYIYCVEKEDKDNVYLLKEIKFSTPMVFTELENVGMDKFAKMIRKRKNEIMSLDNIFNKHMSNE